ncbi:MULTISPECIES: ATP-binding protein [Pasteurellaceae]|uniref:ATP-binding protein n=1 Tax=Pasteurella atlantica TaxID=2827233 RepID=A0AAW8CJH9_9PAST|nr:ATP-binding protein [Pasteurella atlantica]MBR0573297.1 ATP-binding protein [Pasteurella atlantica]MDP8040151.1 ATP-binding protein [Pasteurella atlantica]MDP8042264.1 ATP-binding protein [Pasteurella atlantica]MDP8044429.1 ATP-binding protein [Pasteurella atlantica]MDP8046441.1 ATP-binding protein [Pasteurella atlantica]
MKEQPLLGKIQSVDTGTVSISSDNEDMLNGLQINHIVKIQSTRNGEEIIGLITKVMRKAIENNEENGGQISLENIIKVNLVGTLYKKSGTENNKFKRTLTTLPSVDAKCWLLADDELSEFMMAISHSSKNPLTIGKYTLSENALANLDGNKFFQRHAIIVGGTGSGKSYTVANILEKTALLTSSNALVFDLHGEYSPLSEIENVMLLKVAGANDTLDMDNTIFLPYWLLSYEEMESLLLDRSDSNAPNQARALFDAIINEKKSLLAANGQADILANFTIDSPIPYDITNVITSLKSLDEEMIDGTRSKIKGPLNGKLVRFIQRLESKITDKRLNFIFNNYSQFLDHHWFESLVKKIMGFENKKGLKIIDLSEVPSDILPLITGLIARLIFSIQQWSDKDKRHPIAMFCDEAHLYIPASPKSSSEEKGLHTFERIAKEGRKYGVSLVVISQRPSDVNKTVLSQCGNFIAMRLTNPDDQNVIKRLFPDNLGGLSDILPILDIGESLIVGDACMLPSKIIIDEPQIKPASATIDFWDIWGEANSKSDENLSNAINALRKQSKN